MSAHAEPHITPMKTYFAVYGALLVLTVTTYAVSFAGFEQKIAIIVAMAVAFTKAGLVAAWFMHLKYDTKFNIFVFLSALWFMAVFFTFTMFDISSRGNVLEVMDNFQYRHEVEAAAAGDAAP